MYCKFWTSLAHFYNAFFVDFWIFCFSYNISHFQLSRKESIVKFLSLVMAIKNAKLYCFIVVADDDNFPSLHVVSFTLKLSSFNERNLLIWRTTNRYLINFLMKNMYFFFNWISNSYSLFPYRIPSFRTRAVLWRLF